jgi:hypothetical protein
MAMPSSPRWSVTDWVSPRTSGRAFECLGSMPPPRRRRQQRGISKKSLTPRTMRAPTRPESRRSARTMEAVRTSTCPLVVPSATDKKKLGSITSGPEAQDTSREGRRADQVSHSHRRSPAAGGWCQGRINYESGLQQFRRFSSPTCARQQLREKRRSRHTRLDDSESPNINGLHPIHECAPTGPGSATSSHSHGEPGGGR